MHPLEIWDKLSTASTTTETITRPTAAYTYNTYGIPRSFITSLVLNQFNYPPQYLDTLDKYYLLYWEPTLFTARNRQGCINICNNAENTNYQVIFQGCTPASCKQAKEIVLSFRKPKQDTGIGAYVIVRTRKVNSNNLMEKFI